MKHKALIFLTRILPVAAIAVFGSGSSDCSDDRDVDHDPPAGKGALVVDNNSPENIDVFIDGAFQAKARDGKKKAIDLDPGVYRVVLEQRGGSDQSYRDDIDILEGRNTVLDVSSGFGGDLDVYLFFD